MIIAFENSFLKQRPSGICGLCGGNDGHMMRVPVVFEDRGRHEWHLNL